LLAPHRAWIEGRAALETLERDHIDRARGVFERVLEEMPGQAPAHVGLANACALQFEMTRADERRDTAALASAVDHAREACRLDAEYGEAWATLGFVLDRMGQRGDALAAARRSIALEPDNWRHHMRLAYSAWGEERLRAARRTMSLLPGFPLAHWLIATVHVARGSLSEAARELDLGLASQAADGANMPRFSSVALHWLRGLLHLTADEDQLAMEMFERELASEVFRRGQQHGEHG
jgi:tetratricopeptide (TPR) repeat protein